MVFGQPLIEEEDIEEVVASLRAAWLGTGPKVAKFERLPLSARLSDQDVEDVISAVREVLTTGD